MENHSKVDRKDHASLFFYHSSYNMKLIFTQYILCMCIHVYTYIYNVYTHIYMYICITMSIIFNGNWTSSFIYYSFRQGSIQRK